MCRTLHYEATHTRVFDLPRPPREVAKTVNAASRTRAWRVETSVATVRSMLAPHDADTPTTTTGGPVPTNHDELLLGSVEVAAAMIELVLMSRVNASTQNVTTSL
jgi:hypothetical protein